MRTVDHAVMAVRFDRRFLKISNPLNTLSFIIGNIIPDYSFHTYSKKIGHNFKTARKKLLLAWQSKCSHGEGAVFYFRMGVAAHYICDSFTFPHNRCFNGTLMKHIAYEKAMHKQFLKKDLTAENSPVFSQPESCMRYLEQLHGKYIRLKKQAPKADLSWISHALKTALLSSLMFPKEQRLNVSGIMKSKK